MTVDSFDVVFYTAIFILPGFVTNGVINLVNPPKKHNDGVFVLKCIGYSIISCAVWSWLYQIVLRCSCINTVLRWVLLVGISLLGSALIGLIVAVVKQHQLFDRLLSLFKVKTIHSTPTAWDYIFSKQESGFVIITLIDDKKLYGWYSSNSFASSDPEERDIYVETVYEVENDKWKMDEQGSGFYIPKDQIKVIEFKKGANNNVRNEKEHK